MFLLCVVRLYLFSCIFIKRLLIEYVKDDNEATWKGYFYAALMFVAAVIQSLLLHQYFHRCFLAGMRVRSGIIAAVYHKVSE